MCVSVSVICSTTFNTTSFTFLESRMQQYCQSTLSDRAFKIAGSRTCREQSARVHSDYALTGNIPMKTEEVVQPEFKITESSHSSSPYWHLNTVKMMRLSCYYDCVKCTCSVNATAILLISIF